jgi:hypothetical protein
MKKMLATTILVLFALGCNKSQGAEAANDKAKHDKIVALLELTGALNLGKQVGTAMLGQLESLFSNGGADPKAADLFRKRFTEAIDKEMAIGSPLITDIVDVYARHYSEKELDDMITFYRTETGKKLIKSMPEVVGECMAAGQKWGTGKGVEIAKEIAEKIRGEGYKLPGI